MYREHDTGVVVAVALQQIDDAPHARPTLSAITRTFRVSIAEVKNAIVYLHNIGFVVVEQIYKKEPSERVRRCFSRTGRCFEVHSNSKRHPPDGLCL